MSEYQAVDSSGYLCTIDTVEWLYMNTFRALNPAWRYTSQASNDCVILNRTSDSLFAAPLHMALYTYFCFTR